MRKRVEKKTNYAHTKSLEYEIRQIHFTSHYYDHHFQHYPNILTELCVGYIRSQLNYNYTSYVKRKSSTKLGYKSGTKKKHNFSQNEETAKNVTTVPNMSQNNHGTNQIDDFVQNDVKMLCFVSDGILSVVASRVFFFLYFFLHFIFFFAMDFRCFKCMWVCVLRFKCIVAVVVRCYEYKIQMSYIVTHTHERSLRRALYLMM